MGKHANDGEPRFRFSRIVPPDHQLSDEAIRDLADAMSAGGGSESKTVSAGYTYLGQFLAHDLTRTGRVDVDGTRKRRGFGEFPSPVQFSSPTLDLNSLYDDGPTWDEATDDYYDGVGHLRLGSTAPGPGLPELVDHDVPRHDDGVAVIPDVRNDSNVAVAQTHVAFVRFHNRVLDELTDGGAPLPERFRAARRTVTRHYQWMIKTDYLPTVCDPDVVEDVFDNGRKVFEVGVSPKDTPTMPIEFARAAFRFGHSMLRPRYSWNRVYEHGACDLRLLFQLSFDGGDLQERRRLPSKGVADWRRLYELDGLEVLPDQFNRAMRIDTALAKDLAEMPAKVFGGERKLPPGDPAASLAFRDLMRARDLDLATGQQAARHLRECGAPVTELTREQILGGNGGASLAGLSPAAREAIARDTPLWFYILREAECHDAGKLTDVGARIVAETFHRAMEAPDPSIVTEPAWQPELGPDGDTFRMVDLLTYAFPGGKSGLAPLEPPD